MEAEKIEKAKKEVSLRRPLPNMDQFTFMFALVVRDPFAGTVKEGVHSVLLKCFTIRLKT